MLAPGQRERVTRRAIRFRARSEALGCVSARVLNGSFPFVALSAASELDIAELRLGDPVTLGAGEVLPDHVHVVPVHRAGDAPRLLDIDPASQALVAGRFLGAGDQRGDQQR